MSSIQLFESLLSRSPLPPLVPKRANSDAVAQQIKGLSASAVHLNIIAVLDLLNDDINACHLNVQAREGDETADMMHAILHRREGDFWNSKYWWSQISHPVLDAVHGDRRGAKEFVDQVEKAVSSKDPAELKSCEEKQLEEMRALAEHVQKEHSRES